MSDSLKEFPSRAAAADQAAAIDKSLSYPKKGVSVGLPPHKPIPAVYSPGAAGWSLTASGLEDADDGACLLATLDEAVALGKIDVVVSGKTVKLDLTGAVQEKPAKYEKDK